MKNKEAEKRIWDILNHYSTNKVGDRVNINNRQFEYKSTGWEEVKE